MPSEKKRMEIAKRDDRAIERIQKADAVAFLEAFAYGCDDDPADLANWTARVTANFHLTTPPSFASVLRDDLYFVVAYHGERKPSKDELRDFVAKCAEDL